MIAFSRGVRAINLHGVRNQRVHLYRSVRRPVVLYATADVFVETFDGNAHECIIVKDVSALQSTLGQLVGVLLDTVTVPAQAADGIVRFADRVRRGVRTQ